MAKAWIGTSGWNYKHWWNGEFYPQQLKPPKWLEFFAGHFNTVEINNSFYRLPTQEAFRNWRRQVPDDFTFAVKASRFLTHIKRLKDPEGPLDLFFSRAKHLKEKLGPVLFQLPPRFGANLDRLEVFCRALKSHGAGKKRRCCIEFRDATWLNKPVFNILEKYGIALCFADWRDTPVTEPVTADFVYLRRHYGMAGGGNYSRRNLDGDVERIGGWLGEGLDVFVYFNNDMSGHAIRNAKYVRKSLSLSGWAP